MMYSETKKTDPASCATTFMLDETRVQQNYCRAAATYDQANILAREIARRMNERLEYIRFTPERILDLGCGTGSDLSLLATRYPKANLLGVDFALPMLDKAHDRYPNHKSALWRRLVRKPTPPPLICANAKTLPLPSHSISLLWSNMMLPMMSNPLPAFQEMHRVLETGGMLMFSTLGPDTLKELRAALPSHAGERVHRFIDMHELGDMLIQTGFSDPVMDMEILTLTYTDLADLLNDLRNSGAVNASAARPKTLCGRHGWEKTYRIYETLRQNGRLPASFEIIQGHAWKTAPQTTKDGRTIVHFHPRS